MSARTSKSWLSVVVMLIVVAGSLGIASAFASAPSSHAAPAAPTAGARVAASSSVAPSGTTLTTAAGSLPAPASPHGPALTGRMASTLAAIEAKGIPAKYAFLPNLNGNPHPSLTNGHITPLYGNGPAPYGVGEFGLENVSGTITPYTLTAPSLEGTYAPYDMNGLSADISGPDEYGVQLNAVLNNVQLFNTTGYEFWTQNVIEYSTYSHQLFFVSNIWNFSSSGAPLNANTFASVGPNGTVAAPSYYYGLGGPITVTYPFTLDLFLNSTVIHGDDAVFFNFTLENSTNFWSGSYDNVTFNSMVAGGSPAPIPEYVATGSSYNPIGLPNDFEMVLGGPGGGSNFDVLNSHAYFGLQYWNSTLGTFATVPSAYGFGSETGETSYGVTPIWGYSFPLVTGISLPNAYLTTGASNAIGLWNVSGQGGALYTYGGWLSLNLAPSNAFLFIANGSVFNGWTSTNWSQFQWLPPQTKGFEYEMYPGTYTLVAVLANYDPVETTFTITNAVVTSLPLGLTFDYSQGVYTPLWALNNSGVANISFQSNGNDYAMTNQYLPIGRPAYTGSAFPWFGMANDYLFPIFQGILVYNTTVPFYVLSPPSFQTYYPSWLQPELLQAGLPVWNDLQMMFWNTSQIELSGGQAIGGWWSAGAYFGPAVSSYNVVFWNTTFCLIEQNNFETGGNALYMYGGYDNIIWNNTFTESIPSSGNPSGTVAGAYGSVGLFEADYGNASDYAQAYGGNHTDLCYLAGYCDVTYNNVFDTFDPAVAPYYDPYYFFLATPMCPAAVQAVTGQFYCYFDDSWNVPWQAGPNIIGGPLVGGNYWWNYGNNYNPWVSLPYDNFGPSYGYGIELNGDYNPLSPVPLETVTVTETGLPAATSWWFYSYYASSPYSFTGYNSTLLTSATLLLPAGFYELTASSANGNFGSSSYYVFFNVTNGALAVTVTFVAAYTVSVSETGLPAGTYWLASFYDAAGVYHGETYTNGTSTNLTRLVAGTYTIYGYAYSGYFAAAPEQGTVTVSANTSYTVAFAPLYTTEIKTSGLPSGDSWLLQLKSPTGGNLSYDIYSPDFNLTSVSGTTWSWAVLSTGFEATPASGSFTVTANGTESIVFALPPTTGTLKATVTPGNATVTVDGTPVTGSGGVFSATVGPGTHELVATESGYYTYYTNVTVVAGQTNAFTVTMQAIPPTPTSSSSSSNGISTTAWLLIAVLAVLAVLFLVVAIYFMGKSKKPPAMTQYQAPPAAGGAGSPPPASGGPSPPSGAAAPWSEGGSPPPGAQ